MANTEHLMIIYPASRDMFRTDDNSTVTLAHSKKFDAPISLDTLVATRY